MNATTDRSQLIIISGRSGSGKSTALNVLEDAGFYAIDNLPENLFDSLVQEIQNTDYAAYKKVVISFDARNSTVDFNALIEKIKSLPKSIKCNIVFIDSRTSTLMQRYSETRRKHPLSKIDISLKQAIEIEKTRLQPLQDASHLYIDTTKMSVIELRQIIKKRLCETDESNSISIMFKSFGFKRGVPIDADFVFDVRCLPNPYWDPELRPFTGLDQPIQDFLSSQRDANDMFHDISTYINRWIPKFSSDQRSYITIAIGCTGGIHRSVYISERLKAWYSINHKNIQIHHRELTNKG